MENQILLNVVSVQNLVINELFSFNPESEKTYKVKDKVRKRKFYHFQFQDKDSKRKFNRKFSFDKAQKVPAFLRTPLKDTQIPKGYISQISTIINPNL
jgi:hypothetical protein